MANGYISNPNSSFFSLEDDDIDDAEFLKNSRTYNNSSRSNNRVDDLEQKRQEFLQKKKEIEDKSLESTKRSLGLLKESEQVGIETAEELQRQREQLEKTERNLDNINSTLRFTQKNIDGIKSVFGSIKNYLTKKGDQPTGVSSSREPPLAPVDRTTYFNNVQASTPDEPHPGMALRGFQEQQQQGSGGDLVEQNLEIMAHSLSNLKGLATNLGDEIVSQNELVDKILYNADRADSSIVRQNKEINRLLKK